MFGRAISRWLAIRKTTSYRVSKVKFREYFRDFLNFPKLREIDRKMEDLPTPVQDALKGIAADKGYINYTVETKPVSAIGENSYGLVLQVKFDCPSSLQDPFFCVVKIAPRNTARRTHMKVAEYYHREVFMYDHVLKAFEKFQEEEKIPSDHAFDAVPKKYFSSLETLEEFIIFEDLAQGGFIKNLRHNLPSFQLTVASLKALARYHAMSFAMQAKRPDVFEKLVNEIRHKDNLYTPNMDQVTLEFAKKYIRTTKSMIAEDEDRPHRAKLMQVVQMFEDRFREIALKAVNGTKSAPYSVICHGDFWNNNVLYRYDVNNSPTKAKLIDFQMSRYASPILDIVHYLFACTEKDLRDKHFFEFLNIYHDTLSTHLRLFQLDPNEIYPKAVMDSHLKTYGPYGFCMAIFAVPFFICDANDFPDLDQVSEAVHELSPAGSDCDGSLSNNNSPEMIRKSRVLVEEFDLLNPKTIPHFKRRLIGIVQDLFKYDMVKELARFVRALDEKDLMGEEEQEFENDEKDIETEKNEVNRNYMQRQ